MRRESVLIKHSLKKYNLSNNFDGNENALISIKGIEEYKMPLPEKEFQMIKETESEDDDDDDELESRRECDSNSE